MSKGKKREKKRVEKKGAHSYDNSGGECEGDDEEEDEC
jgi:hypothetical protein